MTETDSDSEIDVDTGPAHVSDFAAGQEPIQYPEPTPPPKKKRGFKRLLKLIALLLIAGAAFVYFKLYVPTKHQNKSPLTSAAKTTIDTTQASKAADAKEPLYVYAEYGGSNSPSKIYSMSATKTNKLLTTISDKLKDNYYSLGHTAVHEQVIVYETYDGIHVSQDGGTSFKNVYPLDPTKIENQQAITSLIFSVNHKKIIFALLPGGTGVLKNTVYSIDIDGKNVTKLHEFEAAGVFVSSYNTDTQQLIYSTGCYFCDGGSGYPRMIDFKTGVDKELFAVDKKYKYNGFVTNPAGTKVLYYIGTNDEKVAAEQAVLGWQGAPPYMVNEYDVKTGTTKQIGTFGQLNEKEKNGNYKSYFATVGYTADTVVPYYTADEKLYVANGAPAVIYTAPFPLNSVSYVSAKQVFAYSLHLVTEADHVKNLHDLYFYNVLTKQNTVLTSTATDLVSIGAQTQ